ncbi:hypothetical protein PC9H_004177 [Pleurotus ostreatus]|uniref:HMG box domain-containing protein n=1 Tax=Pleurotus ostreatus TaxID=5322 RepID=A0A8H6ZZS3_PLEOS|nr:uncharacterized protein PC9H_004177 [Pleurotus ostreatus]KAF7437338.1 hypothetical protein PC9H_004177 [Pleurotus ostreatus]
MSSTGESDMDPIRQDYKARPPMALQLSFRLTRNPPPSSTPAVLAVCPPPSSGSPWSPQDQYLWTLSPQSIADSPSPSSALSTASSLGSPEREARPLKPKGGRSRSPGHIPRPRNSFMIYRSHCLAQKKIDLDVEHDHRIISRIIANLWNTMPAEEKAEWIAKARAEKAAHALKYPDYRYNPKSRKGKDAPVKRKVKRNGEKDLYRATKLAELITAGKTGSELAVAAKQLELIAASPSEDAPATEQRQETEVPASPSLLLHANTPYVWHTESPPSPPKPLLLSQDEPLSHGFQIEPFPTCSSFDSYGRSLEFSAPSDFYGTDTGVYRFDLPTSMQSAHPTQDNSLLELSNFPSLHLGYPDIHLSPVHTSTSAFMTQPLHISNFRGYRGYASWSLEQWIQVYPSLFVEHEGWTFVDWVGMYPDLFAGPLY